MKENYRTIRVSVEFYINEDNISCDQDDLEYSLIKDVEKAFDNQIQNQESVLYQANYIADVDD